MIHNYIFILQKISIMPFPSWKKWRQTLERDIASFRQDLGTESQTLNVLSSHEECEIFGKPLETIRNTFIGLTKRITWALDTMIPISFAFYLGGLVWIGDISLLTLRELLASSLAFLRDDHPNLDRRLRSESYTKAMVFWHLCLVVGLLLANGCADVGRKSWGMLRERSWYDIM